MWSTAVPNFGKSVSNVNGDWSGMLEKPIMARAELAFSHALPTTILLRVYGLRKYVCNREQPERKAYRLICSIVDGVAASCNPLRGHLNFDAHEI